MSVNAIATARMLGGTEVLGIEVKSDRDLEKAVVHGLPAIAVKRDRDLEKAVVHGLPADAVTAIVGQIYPGQTDKFYEVIPRSTLIRRQKEGSLLSTEESQKAERLARVFSFAIEVWGKEEEAREFMQKAHPMLEDRTPFEASLTELGARQVEQILGRLMFGVSA